MHHAEMRTSAAFPLEPSSDQMTSIGRLAVEHVVGFLEKLPSRPAVNLNDQSAMQDVVRSLLGPPPEEGQDPERLFDRLDQAADYGLESGAPGSMSYVPSGGLYSSAVGEFYARGINRYGGVAFAAPALIALEEGVLRWIAQGLCGLPFGSAGIFTTGGSMANFTAVVTARAAHLGEEIATGTLYVTRYTHRSVAKAARLAGIRTDNIRVVPCTDDLRMDVRAAEVMIRADREAGLHPFLLVGSAGTTDTGTVDPLPAMAALARLHDLWFHVDGAYGGFFLLTERGRRRLAGVELADSVTLDPHKSLFLPFGTGTLVVRDPSRLYSAHEEVGDYQQDYRTSDGLPDYAHLGPELSREIRGVRVWLPLHVHGLSAFRAQLDEKLDLADEVYAALGATAALEVPWRPDLSTVAFRVRPRGSTEADLGRADQETRLLLDRINGTGRAFLSSTVVEGRQAIRICILVPHTHWDQLSELLDVVVAAIGRG
jgi:aromatic-L-amino-acid decarboxylase